MLAANSTGPGIGLLMGVEAVGWVNNTIITTFLPIPCLDNRTALPRPDSEAPIIPATCGGTPHSLRIWVDQAPFWEYNASDLSIFQRPDGTFTRWSQQKSTFQWTATGSNLTPTNRGFTTQAHYPFEYHRHDIQLEIFDYGTGSPLPVYFILTRTSAPRLNAQVWWQIVTSPRSPYVAYVQVNLSRHVAVRIFVIALFLTNYVLTLVVIYAVIWAYREKHAKLPREVLLLPLTVIVTLPTIRNSMPGVPDYGMFLDIVGYDFNVVAVVISAIVLFAKVLQQASTVPEDALHSISTHNSPPEEGSLCSVDTRNSASFATAREDSV